MRKIPNLIAALVLGLAALAGARAHEYKAGNLVIEHPWAKPSLKGVANGAAFLTIRNIGTEDDTLVAARADVSKAVELHTHMREGGIMRMRRVEGGIKVPAGKTVKLAPGGYHIMLIGLKAPLVKGSKFPLTLEFAKAGEVKTEVWVEQPTEDGRPADHKHMSH